MRLMVESTQSRMACIITLTYWMGQSMSMRHDRYVLTSVCLAPSCGGLDVVAATLVLAEAHLDVPMQGMLCTDDVVIDGTKACVTCPSPKSSSNFTIFFAVTTLMIVRARRARYIMHYSPPGSCRPASLLL